VLRKAPALRPSSSQVSNDNRAPYPVHGLGLSEARAGLDPSDGNMRQARSEARSGALHDGGYAVWDVIRRTLATDVFVPILFPAWESRRQPALYSVQSLIRLIVHKQDNKPSTSNKPRASGTWAAWSSQTGSGSPPIPGSRRPITAPYAQPSTKDSRHGG
jgi:hypothetical protein